METLRPYSTIINSSKTENGKQTNNANSTITLNINGNEETIRTLKVTFNIP